MSHHKKRGRSVGPHGNVWIVRKLANGGTSIVVHVRGRDDAAVALHLGVGAQVTIVNDAQDD